MKHVDSLPIIRDRFIDEIPFTIYGKNYIGYIDAYDIKTDHIHVHFTSRDPTTKLNVEMSSRSIPLITLASEEYTMLVDEIFHE